ncbi:MAG: hypothetical protein IJA89_02365 [Clostridia bacterium]|nr:hypothetical protein [Clostridia bacterium]
MISRKKLTVSILMVLAVTALFVFFMFNSCRRNEVVINDNPYHPKFSTEYSEDEHIDRIKARTAEIFAEEIENGQLVRYDADILYAFDDDPECFLVELEFAEEWKSWQSGVGYQTKYKHCIGYIKNDEYVIGCFYRYDGPISNAEGIEKIKTAFMDGRSAYSLWATPDEKRYFAPNGYMQCVKRNGVFVTLVHEDCLYENRTVEFHVHKNGGSCKRGEVCTGSVVSQLIYNYDLWGAYAYAP